MVHPVATHKEADIYSPSSLFMPDVSDLCRCDALVPGRQAHMVHADRHRAS